MKSRPLSLALAAVISLVSVSASSRHPQQTGSTATATTVTSIFGFRDATAELDAERRFMGVPDPALAREHLRTLTKAPHLAGTPEDRETAEYVAQKFREAGLDTEIRDYRIWMNTPAEVSVDLVAPAGVTMHGPTREHVDGDPYQDDPRVVTPYNGYSPSGDVEADVVYANYGRPEDLKRLKEMNVDVRGKILLVRYGQNFRGVKSFVGQENGAAAVIIYSDPIDDGYFKGDAYPKGPWRPATGVQRGSIQYTFEYAGDPTTPGIASTPNLPDARRVPPDRAANLPHIPTTPLSYHDAAPILQNLAGPPTPREWQGALPFTYHVGPGPARVRLHLKQNYVWTTIWDVTGRVRGSEFPDELVVAGNHRDAWVYGAVDPNSGSAAMLESVHGIGELLKSGWKPKRTIVFASWDAEEEGLIGSTEWAEDNERALSQAVAYFNMDTGASGANFRASAVGSLKQFVRDLAKVIPAPQGGVVYDVWRLPRPRENEPTPGAVPEQTPTHNAPTREPNVGSLGSGSDYSPFLQHLGVPATDVRSSGDYGVYHSVFDNFAWYTKFGDPDFKYTQEMARVFGLEVLRMADADVLPYDYETYGKDITGFLEAAQRRAQQTFGGKAPTFTAALDAARRFTAAGTAMLKTQNTPKRDSAALNRTLMGVERALLIPAGLPKRPWYKHAIYAPGRYTGYEAVVIPGVNESIDQNDVLATEEGLAAVTAALDRAARVLSTR